MKQLTKRLLSSAVFITITVATIFLAPHWFFFLVAEVFSLLAFNEYLVLAEKKGIRVFRPAVLLVGALLPLSAYFPSNGVWLMAACLIVFVIHFHPKMREHAFLQAAVTIFGLLYIPWFFSHIIKIRDLTHGAWWVFYTILVVKGGDAGAYFVGKSYGKTKLIEHISPNKSVEGALGQFLTTVALSLGSKIYLYDVSFKHLFFLGLVIGILAQLGDLAESVLKRDAGVKDSGQVPGLGGILDVLDSLLLVIPFVFYYLTEIAGIR
ncbi:MAG TPA: phosphatidate cytidylyltransferase [bacterium]|nr:phosphatidate cytidylyltransferase [bacterium]